MLFLSQSLKVYIFIQIPSGFRLRFFILVVRSSPNYPSSYSSLKGSLMEKERKIVSFGKSA
jgi:hypothetical protein